MNGIRERLNGSELQVLALIAREKDIPKSEIINTLYENISQRTLLASLRVLEVIGAVSCIKNRVLCYRITNAGKEILLSKSGK